MHAIDYQLPAWCTYLRLDEFADFIDDVMIGEFFQVTGLSRNHAKHDANALRHACSDLILESQNEFRRFIG